MYDLLSDSARTGRQPRAWLYAEGHGRPWGAAADWNEAHVQLWVDALAGQPIVTRRGSERAPPGCYRPPPIHLAPHRVAPPRVSDCRHRGTLNRVSTASEHRSTVAFEAYLAAEQSSERPHEWVAGRVYTMSGGTERHDLLAGLISMRGWRRSRAVVAAVPSDTIARCASAAPPTTRTS